MPGEGPRPLKPVTAPECRAVGGEAILESAFSQPLQSVDQRFSGDKHFVQ